jgi:hypothetical protein
MLSNVRVLSSHEIHDGFRPGVAAADLSCWHAGQLRTWFALDRSAASSSIDLEQMHDRHTHDCDEAHCNLTLSRSIDAA